MCKGKKGKKSEAPTVIGRLMPKSRHRFSNVFENAQNQIFDMFQLFYFFFSLRLIKLIKIMER
jgi:hypothetical protein